MAMKTRYNVVNGQVLSETRSGVKRDYLTDGLGNTLALLDNTQTKTDTFDYFPSGTVAVRTGTTPTPFQWVGGQGYFTDSPTRKYVRARNFHNNLGRWGSQDPIGFNAGDYNLYRYANNRFVTATDPSGLAKVVPVHFDQWVQGDTPVTGKGFVRNCCGGFQGKWEIRTTGSLNPEYCYANKFGQVRGYIAQLVTIDENTITSCDAKNVVQTCACKAYLEMFQVAVNVMGNGLVVDIAKTGWPQDYFWHGENGGYLFSTLGSYKLHGEAKFFSFLHAGTPDKLPKQGFIVGEDKTTCLSRPPCGGMSGGLPYKVINSLSDLPSWWNGAGDDDGTSVTHNGEAHWDCCVKMASSKTTVSPPQNRIGRACF